MKENKIRTSLIDTSSGKQEEYIWIAGTKRCIGPKNRYGLYTIGIDDKDVEWLNNHERIIAINRSEVYDEMNVVLKEKNKEIHKLQNSFLQLQDETFIRMDKELLEKFKRFCKQESKK